MYYCIVLNHIFFYIAPLLFVTTLFFILFLFYT